MDQSHGPPPTNSPYAGQPFIQQPYQNQQLPIPPLMHHVGNQYQHQNGHNRPFQQNFQNHQQKYNNRRRHQYTDNRQNHGPPPPQMQPHHMVPIPPHYQAGPPMGAPPPAVPEYIPMGMIPQLMSMNPEVHPSQPQNFDFAPPNPPHIAPTRENPPRHQQHTRSSPGNTFSQNTPASTFSVQSNQTQNSPPRSSCSTCSSSSNDSGKTITCTVTFNQKSVTVEVTPEQMQHHMQNDCEICHLFVGGTALSYSTNVGEGRNKKGRSGRKAVDATAGVRLGSGREEPGGTAPSGIVANQEMPPHNQTDRDSVVNLGQETEVQASETKEEQGQGKKEEKKEVEEQNEQKQLKEQKNDKDEDKNDDETGGEVEDEKKNQDVEEDEEENREAVQVKEAAEDKQVIQGSEVAQTDKQAQDKKVAQTEESIQSKNIVQVLEQAQGEKAAQIEKLIQGKELAQGEKAVQSEEVVHVEEHVQGNKTAETETVIQNEEVAQSVEQAQSELEVVKKEESEEENEEGEEVAKKAEGDAENVKKNPNEFVLKELPQAGDLKIQELVGVELEGNQNSGELNAVLSGQSIVLEKGHDMNGQGLVFGDTLQLVSEHPATGDAFQFIQQDPLNAGALQIIHEETAAQIQEEEAMVLQQPPPRRVWEVLEEYVPPPMDIAFEAPAQAPPAWKNKKEKFKRVRKEDVGSFTNFQM